MAGICFLFFAALGMGAAALAFLISGPIVFLFLTAATFLSMLAAFGVTQRNPD